MIHFGSLMPLAQLETPTDAVWRLEAAGLFAPWLLITLIAAAVALVAYCYSKELSPAGQVYRWLLGGLRMVTIGLILVMLSELLLSGTRSGQPRMTILLDRSGSMQVVDPGARETLPEEVRAELDSSNDPTRQQIAQGILTASDAEVLRQLERQYEVNVVTVGDVASPVAKAESLAETLAAIQAPSENASSATRLGEAIEQALDSSGGVPPQAMLVLTDGQNTVGRNLSAAAESARRAGTPLYFVGIGADQAPPDLAITDLLADEAAFIDDLVSFRATLRHAQPLADPVKVTLRQAGDSAILAEQVIEPTTDSTSPVQIVFRPKQAGTFQYEIAVQPLDGERDTQNNQLTHTMTVHDGKLRVLLAAGYPSYEFRYLKHLLERDRTVEVSTMLQEADAKAAAADATAITRFPIRASELEEYDVVVLMDLDPRLLPRSTWSQLRAFVAKQGGGLALVAGPRYLPWAYRGLDDFKALLPVQADRTPVDGSVIEAGYKVTPTELGLRLPAMQLDDSLAETRGVWRDLPPLYWYAELGELKPAAQVLAQHPAATTADGKPVPLIASQYFGSGQVLMHAVDSTYRWRYRVGEVYFARYWVQTLRNLARGKLSAGNSQATLATDQATYERGEPVRLRLRGQVPAQTAGQEDGAPVTVVIETEGAAQRRVQLAPQPALPGVYETTIDDLPVGRYRVLLADGTTKAAGVPVASSFEVLPPPGEFVSLQRNATEMQAAAQRTRGIYLPVEESNRLAEILPQGQRVPIETLPPIELWNRWWMLAAIVSCLSTEWILRKRKAML